MFFNVSFFFWFEGTRKEGDRIDEVAFKEVLSEQRANDLILESDIYQRIGEHGKSNAFKLIYLIENNCFNQTNLKTN